ncbi:GNAT family N-acetyltransferase [Edaphobacter albus]|uniref:GNAT family N-acetyltransferase n=1 Tax=Edaphobacter sp. 4G125 TaxID=2763071 RepID=UPI001645B9C0|nr:GNAT family N-acetyltransferase [Edaphobacter sp. 4G125]QNI37966.1 GNAT family N-acetyltransferase [Edaphobacter sp. 4G125]
MFETRVATVEDAELIAEHRRKMFAEMGDSSAEQLQAMKESFVPWVRERLVDGRYLGWIVSNGEKVVAGAGVWFMDFLPHWRDLNPQRAYLTNFYVSAEMRGQGLAHGLVRRAVEAAQTRGIKVVILHASLAGRPIYERNGFKASNEMMLDLGGESAFED